ncbi:MAG: hypothetical protein IKW07_06815 [Clostridia bacterium]|nr:hypothetical protein [Clostridia bacterium]
MELTVTKNPNPGKLPDSNNLVFGRTFTDHMFLMDYTRAEDPFQWTCPVTFAE